MRLELTDAEVRRAILDYLAERVEMPADLATVNMRRLYYNEGTGFEAVVELPPEAEATP